MSDDKSPVFLQPGDGEYPIAEVILTLTNDLLEFAVASSLARQSSPILLTGDGLAQRVAAEKALIVDRIFGNRRDGRCHGGQLFEAALRRGLEILEESPDRG